VFICGYTLLVFLRMAAILAAEAINGTAFRARSLS
jgi:hypothetical protein